jgi:hypothetical protein
MIAQILNNEFLLGAAENTRLGLKKTLEDRERRVEAAESPLSELGTEELQEVMVELDRAVRDAEANDTGDPQSTTIWMPREPILAIIQSELTRLAEERPKAIETEPEGPASRRIADENTETREDGRRAFGAFEVTRPKILSDPRWLWSGVVIAWNAFKKKAEFGGLPERPVAIADDAQILLVGDWGSGLPRARAVAHQMRLTLDAGKAARREQHVIHLGDVYYTGSKREYEEHFLANWPVQTGEDIASYTLCGNHDMYSGGHAYYATALADPRFARQAGKSVFALANGSWQILALDSSYQDQHLHGAQPAWIGQQLEAADRRRTMLLSHHQLWSAYENAGDGLRPDVTQMLAAGKIDAWLWAHEHRCLTYGPRENLAFSGCVGHGGIPEYLIAREGDPYPPGLRYDYRAKHGTGIEPWNTFGFAVLELEGPNITIRYIDEDGRNHHEETLP